MMNAGQRQIIAEKISSTIRVLELLGFNYEVSRPKNKREKGNKSPRVVYVDLGESGSLRIYNSISGNTWANEPNGKPIAEIKSVEGLYNYLLKRYGDRTKQLRMKKL
ncbi:MAG: hypothetical protein QY302_05680 [Anaerolineales bacterium]|nr:MAG: hypothetical protein QY302_05680 [Anaerolineales bacterium]